MKFDAKYFQVKQFFRNKQYFLRKLQKIVLWAQLTIFKKVRGCLTPKINKTFSIPNYVPETIIEQVL